METFRASNYRKNAWRGEGLQPRSNKKTAEDWISEMAAMKGFSFAMNCQYSLILLALRQDLG
jgi:hypothetical protein